MLLLAFEHGLLFLKDGKFVEKALPLVFVDARNLLEAIRDVLDHSVELLNFDLEDGACLADTLDRVRVILHTGNVLQGQKVAGAHDYDFLWHNHHVVFLDRP